SPGGIQAGTGRLLTFVCASVPHSRCRISTDQRTPENPSTPRGDGTEGPLLRVPGVCPTDLLRRDSLPGSGSPSSIGYTGEEAVESGEDHGAARVGDGSIPTV